MKTHWKKLRNYSYLGSQDLYDQNGEKTVIHTRIASVKSEMVTNQDGEKELCIVAHLENTKPMILNATNCKKLEAFANSPLIENWAGLAVTIKIERVRAFGAWHEALRFDKNQPKIETKSEPKTLPNLNPTSDKWQEAVNYVRSTADKDAAKKAIQSKYTITPGDWAELISNENTI